MKKRNRDDDDNDPSVGSSKLKLNRPAATVYSRRGQTPQAHNTKVSGIKTPPPPKLTTPIPIPIPMDPHQFLQAVEERFHDERGKFNEFRQILSDYKFQRIDGRIVAARIRQLFVGHNDLILGFNTFLPKEVQIKVGLEEPPKEFSVKPDVGQLPLREFRKNENEDKPPKEFPVKASECKLKIKEDDYEPSSKEEQTKLEVEKATNFMNKVKSRFQSDGHVYEGFLELLNVYQEESKSITEVYREVAILFRGHPDLLEEFKEFLPDSSTSTLQSMPGEGVDIAAAQGSNMDSDSVEAIDLIRKVKTRFQSDYHVYRAFMEILNVYQQENKSITQVYQEVFVLFRHHPDLLDEFTHFLPDFGVVHYGLPARNTPLLPPEDDTSSAPTSVLIHSAAKDRNHDKEREKERSDKSAAANHGSSICKGKCVSKSLAELDCNPSYQKNDQVSVASWRSELDIEVLNDFWVLIPFRNGVPSGSGCLKKSQYEESLFRCEDERFELDMLIESVKSTAKHAEELLHKINESCEQNSPICIEDHFTVLNLKCIERIYGDHGPHMLSELRENTTPALLILLNRLKQKQEEWSRSRSDFDKIWAEIYAKNRDKPLGQPSS